MDYIISLLPTFDSLGILGYWLVLIASLVESLVLIGTIFPGSVLVILAGFASSHGVLDVGDLIWFAAIGAVIGDGISYYIGKRGSAHIKESHLALGERFFEKYGNKSIFLGRFFGPLRAVVPFVAGISHMKPRSFFFWNITSGLLWAIGYVLLGYLFGSSLKSFEIWSTRIGLFVLVFVVIGVLIWFLVKNSKYIFHLLKSISVSISEAVLNNKDVQDLLLRHTNAVTFLKKRFDKKAFSGLPLTIFTLIFLYGLLTLVGLIEDVLTADPIVALDTYIASLLVAYRDPFITEIFLKITALGSMEVVIVLSILFLSFLILKSKKGYVVPFIVTITGTSVFTYLAKIIIHRERPSGLIPLVSETSFSFPSGHAAIIVALVGFIAYVFVRKRMEIHKNAKIVFIAVSVIFLVGVSRLYLGVHFLSDVLAGYLMGLLWLITGIVLTEIYLNRNKHSGQKNELESDR